MEIVPFQASVVKYLAGNAEEFVCLFFNESIQDIQE